MLRKITLTAVCAAMLFSTVPARADGPITLGLGTLTSIALSPDGTRLAVGTTIGVYYYDAQTFVPQGFWDTGYRVNFLRWSPRGDVLAVIHNYRLVDFRPAADGSVLWSSEVPYRRAVTFSSDGSQAIVATNGTTANVFDAVTGAKIGTTTGEFWSMPDWYVSLSPNRQWQASAGWGGGIYLREFGGSERRYGLQGHHGGYSSYHTFAWSPDSRILYSAGDNAVFAWDVATGAQLRILDGFSPVVGPIAWTADGQQIISAEGDNLVVVDVARHLPVRVGWLDEYQRNRYPLASMATSPSGNVIAIADAWGGGVSLYDYATLNPLRRLQIGRSVRILAFNPDGRYLATAGDGPFVNIWEVATGRGILDLLGSSANRRVLALEFSTDGQTLYVLEADGLLLRWDLATHTSTSTPMSAICNWCLLQGVIHLPTSRVIFYQGSDVAVSDAANGQLLHFLEGYHPHSYSDEPESMIINPQGTRVAITTGFYGGSIKIWDLRSGALVTDYTAPTEFNYRTSIAFSPDGHSLASGGDDGTIRIWPVP